MIEKSHKTVANPIPNAPTSAESAMQVKDGAHPLDDVIGAYEGEMWERILKNIKRNRRQLDKEFAVPT